MGLVTMMKTPADKQTSYFVVSLLAMLGAFVIIGLVIGVVMSAIFITSGAF
jgi:hypothetical protein